MYINWTWYTQYIKKLNDFNYIIPEDKFAKRLWTLWRSCSQEQPFWKQSKVRYSWFHIKGSWSVHSFNGDYLISLVHTGSWGNLFNEIPGTILKRLCSSEHWIKRVTMKLRSTFLKKVPKNFQLRHPFCFPVSLFLCLFIPDRIDLWLCNLNYY